MRITILGSGTSQGVPVIGCDCHVCCSTDSRDKRLRVSAKIEVAGKTFVIDCGPDFRQQMLASDTRSLDALLITHEHNDHIIGMDDVRPFNFKQNQEMPVYAHPRVAAELQQRFAYVFADERYPGAPVVRLMHIDHSKPFTVLGVPVMPIEALHGRLPVLGFRIGQFTYLTDVKTISPDELDKVRGTDTLVINALHHTPHYTHLNLEDALHLIAQVTPRQTYLTHMSHRMGLFADLAAQLPPGVQPAYDGLCFECPC